MGERGRNLRREGGREEVRRGKGEGMEGGEKGRGKRE